MQAPQKEPFCTPIAGFILKLLLVVVAVFVVLMNTGCYGAKKATRQVLKAQTYHPEVVAKACADLFPIKETTVTKIVTKEGKTDTVANYVLVDCDSVAKANLKDFKGRSIVKVPCPPSLTRVDTVEKDRLVIQENTARISQLTTEKQNERDARIKAEGKAKTWFWVAMVLGAYTLARWIVKYFTGYSLP